SEFPLPLVVDTWFSTISSKSLVQPGDIQISAVSRAEYRDQWYRIDRKTTDGWEPADKSTPFGRVLYRPFGTMIPNVEVLVSDADFVEVLTEIDIQTPLPEWVKTHRTGRHFLFLGCHFDDQTTRMFARQIMKRSSNRHFVVTDGPILPKEGRFYEQEGIAVLPLSLNNAFLPKLKEELERN
ncbi:MAG: SIR2 family protein, partial [Leptospirillum sp.]